MDVLGALTAPRPLAARRLLVLVDEEMARQWHVLLGHLVLVVLRLVGGGEQPVGWGKVLWVALDRRIPCFVDLRVARDHLAFLWIIERHLPALPFDEDLLEARGHVRGDLEKLHL